MTIKGLYTLEQILFPFKVIFSSVNYKDIMVWMYVFPRIHRMNLRPNVIVSRGGGSLEGKIKS